MKTKQKVKLKYYTPIKYISEAIRYSHSNHHLSDTEKTEILKMFYEGYECCEDFVNVIGDKDFDLIKRIGFKHKHESVLEFGTFIFDVKLSTKALLEESRHRISVSKTVTSSRYALNKIDILFEPTDDKDIDKDMKKWKKKIIKRLNQNKPLDKVAEMLPQAFIYSMQWQFNLRSLLHFLRLRLTREAHRDIRLIAFMLINELPEKYKELVMLDDEISLNYKRFKEMLDG